ncbi:hypothetical protein D3C87_1992450 [compost metagenome]
MFRRLADSLLEAAAKPCVGECARNDADHCGQRKGAQTDSEESGCDIDDEEGKHRRKTQHQQIAEGIAAETR